MDATTIQIIVEMWEAGSIQTLGLIGGTFAMTWGNLSELLRYTFN